MGKFYHSIVALYCVFVFLSCRGQVSREQACLERFKRARELVSSGSRNRSNLDSAMRLVSDVSLCKNIRVAVVDFKITLFVSMEKWHEGRNFIDSLNESDFSFNYKKEFMGKALWAREFDSRGDTANRNRIYQGIVEYIERYVSDKPDMSDKEFNEVYTDLFATKEKYLDATRISSDAEVLISRYPAKRAFFEFLKEK